MIQFRHPFRLRLLIAGTVLAAQDSKPLPTTASPGKTIQHAAQAAADDLAHGLPKDGALEILSGTQGVDFKAYSHKVSTAVRNTWSLSIPPDVRVRKGTVTIEFRVLPDGKIGAMKLVSSGNLLLSPLRHPSCANSSSSLS